MHRIKFQLLRKGYGLNKSESKRKSCIHSGETVPHTFIAFLGTYRLKTTQNERQQSILQHTALSTMGNNNQLILPELLQHKSQVKDDSNIWDFPPKKK